MEFVDQPQPKKVRVVSPEIAVMSGRIKTNSVEELRRFERTFPLNPTIVVTLADKIREQFGDKVLSPKEKTDVIFHHLFPSCFLSTMAHGWTASFHFEIENAGDYTISVEGDKVAIRDGLIGDATCHVETDSDIFFAILRFEALEDAGQMDEVQIEKDEDLDEELSDAQLELVAGGKGCGAEACAADACGSAACGAAAGAGGACGAASCGAAAGVATACGADSCAAAVCAAAACGAAVGASACAADACGAAAGVGACAAAACGAAAGVGACAGDACGAAVGAGVCAGNVCGVDVLGGADVGPCAINVIPILPFI